MIAFISTQHSPYWSNFGWQLAICIAYCMICLQHLFYRVVAGSIVTTLVCNFSYHCLMSKLISDRISHSPVHAKGCCMACIQGKDLKILVGLKVGLLPVIICYWSNLWNSYRFLYMLNFISHSFLFCILNDMWFICEVASIMLWSWSESVHADFIYVKNLWTWTATKLERLNWLSTSFTMCIYVELLWGCCTLHLPVGLLHSPLQSAPPNVPDALWTSPCGFYTLCLPMGLLHSAFPHGAGALCTSHLGLLHSAPPCGAVALAAAICASPLACCTLHFPLEAAAICASV
jgi:hypothetical protein